MTELEWDASADPGVLLTFAAGRLSDRKLRLYLVGCCRRRPELLTDDRVRMAVAHAEGAADGRAGADLAAGVVLAREATELYAWAGDRGGPAADVAHMTAVAAWVACDLPKDLRRVRAPAPGRRAVPLVWAAEGPEQLARAAATTVTRAQAQGETRWAFEYAVERSEQADLLRCVAGSPFVYSVPDPVWRTAAVQDMAADIYRDRAFHRLPVLADALCEAGCDAADVLTHCRQHTEHTRGCWVVDLLLDRV